MPYRLHVQVGSTWKGLRWVDQGGFDTVEAAQAVACSLWCLDARVVDTAGQTVWTLSEEG
jgi:hypothetical protein